MLNLKLDTKLLEKYHLSINELLLLVKVSDPTIPFFTTPIVYRKVIDMKYVYLKGGKFKLTEKGDEIVSLFTSKKVHDITQLAITLREIYPIGKKGGQYYWKGSVSEIERKLKVFYIKYGTDYTPESIVEATMNYVRSFQGKDMDKAMMLLKYFIEKNGTSTLTSHLDNPKELDSLEIDYGNSVEL